MCLNLLYRHGFVVALGLRLPDLQLWQSVYKPDKTDLRKAMLGSGLECHIEARIGHQLISAEASWGLPQVPST